MTSFSTADTESGRAGVLGVTGSPDLAVGTLIFWAVGMYVVGGLALVASRDEGKEGGIRYDDRLSLSSGFHSYLQSSWESDMTRVF